MDHKSEGQKTMGGGGGGAYGQKQLGQEGRLGGQQMETEAGLVQVLLCRSCTSTFPYRAAARSQKRLRGADRVSTIKQKP